MAAKPRILWCSQSPALHTGYGVITHDILERLHATGNYEIGCHAWHERPALSPKYPQQAMSASQFPYKLFSSDDPAGPKVETLHDRMGKKNFHEVIEFFRPDIVIMFGDIYMFDYVFDHPDKNKFHLAVYYPLDGAPMPMAWAESIRRADTLITFSKFAVETTKERTKKAPILIYHGIDYPMWSTPVDEKTILGNRKQLFPDEPNPFIFGMVARNQPRKNIPVFLEAFSAHSKTHPHSRVLLHSVPRDQGWDLNVLVQEFRLLKDKVYIPQNLTPQRGIDNKDLRIIYNCMNVHVNTAWGEGFGIPILESMACGIPNIVPDYTTGPELVGESKSGLLLKPAAVYSVEALSHIRRFIVDPLNLLDTMNFMAENESPLKEYSKRAKTKAAEFNWDNIMPLWIKTIDDIMVNKKTYPIEFEAI